MVSFTNIIMPFLSTESPQKLKRFMILLIILFYVILSYKDFSFFIKNTKKQVQLLWTPIGPPAFKSLN